MNVQTKHLPSKIVAVMFENHSFDHILGYLSNKSNGVSGKNLSNPVPEDVASAVGISSIPVHPTTIFDLVDLKVNPGEEYGYINIDLYNSLDPQNVAKQGPNMVSPYNVPSCPSSLNQGFVTSYVNQIRANGASQHVYLQNASHFGAIMGCLPPSEVPVISTLARHSAVFDHWFCDVPTDTDPNRMFFHSGTSQGQMLDHFPTPTNLMTKNTQRTIFNQLHDANKTWIIYSDNVFALTLLLHFPVLSPFIATNFKKMADFYGDAAAGQLPDYSFIEPVFLGAPEDYHPWDSDSLFPDHSSILAGENFLAQIYNSIKTAPNANDILFAITFDEIGGTYDHVHPASATPPGDNFVGEEDFTFDRLGLRVPMIWVNCYIGPGTIIHKPLQHTSFLHVIRSLLHLPPIPLTNRDRDAPNINFNEIFTDICTPLPDVHPRQDPNPPLNTTAAQSQFLDPSIRGLIAAFTPLLTQLGIPIPTSP